MTRGIYSLIAPYLSSTLVLYFALKRKVIWKNLCHQVSSSSTFVILLLREYNRQSEIEWLRERVVTFQLVLIRIFLKITCRMEVERFSHKEWKKIVIFLIVWKAILRETDYQTWIRAIASIRKWFRRTRIWLDFEIGWWKIKLKIDSGKEKMFVFSRY